MSRFILGVRNNARLVGLTRSTPVATFALASRPDGRLAMSGEESPGSMDKRCRVTPGGGDPRESATESRPPDMRPPGRMSGKGERVG